MSYLRKSKSRGKLYYQVVLDDGKIIQLGTIKKILKVFSFYKEHNIKNIIDFGGK